MIPTYTETLNLLYLCCLLTHFRPRDANRGSRFFNKFISQTSLANLPSSLVTRMVLFPIVLWPLFFNSSLRRATESSFGIMCLELCMPWE